MLEQISMDCQGVTLRKSSKTMQFGPDEIQMEIVPHSF